MADIFPVDTSGIDMVNQVFNYYMPDASITGDVKVLDQDYDTVLYLENPEHNYLEVLLGQTVYINDIIIDVTNYHPDASAYIDISSDYGTTWSSIPSTSIYVSTSLIRATINDTITNVKFTIDENLTHKIAIKRIAAYAPEDATHPTEGQKFVIRQGGVPIHTHDFGNVSIESGVYETFEVYNTGSTILSGIRVYEVKDDNNDSNVYYKFSLDSSTWYDHSITIDEPLYPSSGITFYAMVYAPSDASFGNNTIYFRVLAYDTGTEP